MSPGNDRRVNANPEKRFFIEMLIKDIELVPAIVDLVDNSVDAARALRGRRKLNGLSIVLKATESQFSIVDNCGGLEAGVARKYAFRFGRPRKFPSVESSVGQFGIGMKRALFKLGNLFVIQSIAEQSRFKLTVQVDEWAEADAPDWSFDLDEVRYRQSNSLDERGTSIIVEELYASVSADFANPEKIHDLRREIAMKHQPALSDGLVIEVNERILSAHQPRLLASKTLTPINQSFTIQANGNGSVRVQLVAGLAEAQKRDSRKNEDDATEFPEPGDAGWYVYCNERMVLAAERSTLTGWGSAAAAYHPQYRRFRGYVYLRAKDSSLLPWNTTKTGLDQDSPIFRRIQQEMFRVLATVQAVINRAKAEKRDYPREADQRLNNAIDNAPPTPIKDLPASKVFVSPTVARKRRTPAHLVNVQYQAPRDDMDRAIEKLKVDSAAKAGLATFEYYVDAELTEEEE